MYFTKIFDPESIKRTCFSSFFLVNLNEASFSIWCLSFDFGTPTKMWLKKISSFNSVPKKRFYSAMASTFEKHGYISTYDVSSSAMTFWSTNSAKNFATVKLSTRIYFSCFLIFIYSFSVSLYYLLVILLFSDFSYFSKTFPTLLRLFLLFRDFFYFLGLFLIQFHLTLSKLI